MQNIYIYTHEAAARPVAFRPLTLNPKPFGPQVDLSEGPVGFARVFLHHFEKTNPAY